MLAGVSAVRNAEAKVKVEALQQVIAEVVSLDHAKVVQGSVSNGEFHTVIGLEGERGGDRENSESVTSQTLVELLCNRAVALETMQKQF